MNKIYFAGSIRGGRNDLNVYKTIIGHLRNFGVVLTEHIGYDGITPAGEVGLTDEDIYTRDLDWLVSSDVVVAEVSTPSLGVGFEVAKATELHKKVLCLYHAKAENQLSAMITGCPDVHVKHYRSIDEVKLLIDAFFSEI
jgi:2'-deoxynucleoside 5'-phosphate N-hydrolase